MTEENKNEQTTKADAIEVARNGAHCVKEFRSALKNEKLEPHELHGLTVEWMRLQFRNI